MRRTDALERYVRSVTDEKRLISGRSLPGDMHPAVVTISRQAGCGAHRVAEAVLDRLPASPSKMAPPWTVFDRELVDRVLADHGLPERIAQFMPEDHVSDVADAVEHLFGLHPPSGMLVRKTAETILHLAEAGNVVIIGRAANIVTRSVPYAFHVRLVGSFERRVRLIEDRMQLAHPAAVEHVRKTDAARRGYVHKYYRVEIDDPVLYHLVINMDRMSAIETADVIVAGMRAVRSEDALPVVATAPTG